MMKTSVLSVILVLILSACGGDSAFVGKWVSAKNECSTIEILKDGAGYRANVDAPGFLMRDRYSWPASIRDGVIYVKTPNGEKPLVINDAAGSLDAGGNVYHRATGKERDCSGKK